MGCINYTTMDISKRRFKIKEGFETFTVMVEVPKYKTRGAFWWKESYYDEADLQWAIVTSAGNLLYEGSPAPVATFKSMSAAREFIKHIQTPARETIVEAPETRVVEMKRPRVDTSRESR